MKPLKKISKLEYASEQIQGWILKNTLKENSLLLSEAEFAQKLNVSRSTVREALRKLETVGIVDVTHGKKAQVSKFDLDRFFNILKMFIVLNKDDFINLMELRKILELGTIEIVINKITKEHMLNLERFIKSMKKNLLDYELFAMSDYNFHLEIIKSTDNVLLLKLMDIIGIAILKVQKITSRFPSAKIAIIHHENILNAIKSKDIIRTKKILLEHINTTERTLVDYFDIKE